MRAIPNNYYDFAEFRLDVDERQLLLSNEPLEITPKAFDVLQLLVENAGRTVTKEAIFARVWSESFVEETNLSHHIFRLRKILGETNERKFIETAPKRGYRFVADVRQAGDRVDLIAPPVGKRYSRAIFAGGALLGLAILAGGFMLYRSAAKISQASNIEVSPPPQSISRITDGGKYVAATISPDGKFVAYGQNHTSGEGMLYIRHLETNNERRLLPPAERNLGTINFSPDGTFIYYIAYEPGDPEGALYRVSVIGGEPTRLLANVKFMFSISPDAAQAAFYRFDEAPQQRRVVVANLDGSGTEKTVLTLQNAGISSVPAFSPDGRYLSFSAADLANDFTRPQFALSVIDLQSGNTRRISEEKWLEIGKTVWRHDGKGLVFPANRPRSGTQIYSMSFPEGDVRQVTNELNYYGNYGMGITRDGSAIVGDLWETQAQLWLVESGGTRAGAEQLTNGISDGAVGLASLSGGRIAYTTRSGDDTDVWMLRHDETSLEGKPLTSDASREGGLCTAPDGNFIIFSSDRAGASHLFRMNTDGSDVKQLTFGSGREDLPACSPDGSFVIYAAQGAIWKVSTAGGEPTKLTDFECVAPSVAPDGKHFACVQPTGFQVKNSVLAVVPIEGGQPVKVFDVVPFGFYYRPVSWTSDGRGLIFRKTEKQVGNLWRQDISGGDPTKISDFRSDVIFNHTLSQDGKHLIVSRGKVAYNPVILRNFR